MGVKVRVKRNIGKDSEEYFGKPNGKVYELTDKFRLIDDDGYEWGSNRFKDEQEFIEYMKDVISSSTEFEVVDEKTKWKCVELNNVSGFTEGKIYEVCEDGMIYYDSGNPCKGDTFKINGNKAECWRAKFEKVEEDEKVKLKVGDRVVVNGERNCQLFNNAKGKVVTIDSIDYGVEFDDGKDFMHNLCGEGKSKHCFYVYKNMVTLDNTIKKEEEKVVNKFKVGDIIKGKANNEKYGYTNKDMTKGEVTKVRGENKIEVKIIEHAKDNSQIGNKYYVESDYFELVSPPKKSIHLTFDGNITHAVVKEDGKVVKREKVGLFSGDVYDEATGAREVINKLYGKKVVEDVKSKFSIGDKVKLLDGKGKGSSSVYGWAELVKPSQISEYTTDELLLEIKKRMER